MIKIAPNILFLRFEWRKGLKNKKLKKNIIIYLPPMYLQKPVSVLSKIHKKNHVFNLIGHPTHTLDAIYDISFILYRREVPYGITTKSYFVSDNVLVPSYYSQLRHHISGLDTKVILNNCGLTNCKETWNIKNYVNTISSEKWSTTNLFVYKNKTHVKYNHFSELCSNCEDCTVPKDLFILSVSLQEKINHIENLVS
jgi:hypothetical protein